VAVLADDDLDMHGNSKRAGDVDEAVAGLEGNQREQDLLRRRAAETGQGSDIVLMLPRLDGAGAPLY
jgi:hypothetical protein